MAEPTVTESQAEPTQPEIEPVATETPPTETHDESVAKPTEAPKKPEWDKQRQYLDEKLAEQRKQHELELAEVKGRLAAVMEAKSQPAAPTQPVPDELAEDRAAIEPLAKLDDEEFVAAKQIKPLVQVTRRLLQEKEDRAKREAVEASQTAEERRFYEKLAADHPDLDLAKADAKRRQLWDEIRREGYTTDAPLELSKRFHAALPSLEKTPTPVEKSAAAPPTAPPPRVSVPAGARVTPTNPGARPVAQTRKDVVQQFADHWKGIE
jgi:hypothetical protein